MDNLSKSKLCQKIILGLLAVLTIACASVETTESPTQLPTNNINGVYQYQLANGMQVLVKPDRRAPVVVSQLWYKVGSSYEYNGITGISHMLEHMLFKGTEKLAPGEFSEIIAANGGKENAFTGRDYTAYFELIANDRLEICLELEADRMRNVIFNAEEFAKERAVVAEERRLRYDDQPQVLTYEHLYATAFTNSPYQNPVIGWMTDIKNYQMLDAKSWYDQWYAPNHATLVIVGDVQPQAVFALAEKYFAAIPASTAPELKPRIEVPQQGLRRIEVKAPANVPYLIMGFKVPVLKTATDPAEVYALAVLASILSDGNSARLPRDLIRGQQLAVAANASYDPYSRIEDLFILDATPIAATDTATLEQALLEQIRLLQQQPVTAAELARVKNQIVAANVYERDSMYYQAMQLGMLITVGLDWQLATKYVANIQAVTAEQVQQVAQKYLTQDRLTIAELIPLPMEGAP